jgi:hypothetical protein
MFAWWRDYYDEFLKFRKRKGLVWCYKNPITQFHDEVNDLFASQMYQEPGQKEVSTKGTWFIRKCRGFYIRFIGSTHRIRNLNRGVWTQMGFFMFKRSHAADAMQLVTEMIPHLNTERRKKLSEKVGYLEKHEIFIVDNQGKYGIIPNDDITRVYPKGLDLAGSYNYIEILESEAPDNGGESSVSPTTNKELIKKGIIEDNLSFLKDIRLFKEVPKTKTDIEVELKSGPSADYDAYTKDGTLPEWIEKTKDNPKFDQQLYDQMYDTVWKELKKDLRKIRREVFFEKIGAQFDFRVQNPKHPDLVPVDIVFPEYDVERILIEMGKNKRITILSFAEAYYYVAEILYQLGIRKKLINTVVWSGFRSEYELLDPAGAEKVRKTVTDLLHYIATVSPRNSLDGNRKFDVQFKDEIIAQAMGRIKQDQVFLNHLNLFEKQKEELLKEKNAIERKIMEKDIFKVKMVGS